jgi:hypothetical protein
VSGARVLTRSPKFRSTTKPTWFRAIIVFLSILDSRQTSRVARVDAPTGSA